MASGKTKPIPENVKRYGKGSWWSIDSVQSLINTFLTLSFGWWDYGLWIRLLRELLFVTGKYKWDCRCNPEYGWNGVCALEVPSHPKINITNGRPPGPYFYWFASLLISRMSMQMQHTHNDTMSADVGKDCRERACLRWRNLMNSCARTDRLETG